MALRSELEENPLAPPIDEEFQHYRDRFETEKEFHEAVEVWPRCPQCGKRRITRCPICHTSSDVFPLGDPEFWNAEARAGENAEEAHKNHCGCCGSCKEQRLTYDESESPSTLEGEIFPGVPSARRREFLASKTSDAFDDLADERETSPTFQPPVVCPTCSEAFDPVFLRDCEWCGYDFGDGERFDASLAAPADPSVDDFIKRKEETPEPDYEANASRLMWTLAALGALGVGIFAYLAIALR